MQPSPIRTLAQQENGGGKGNPRRLRLHTRSWKRRWDRKGGCSPLPLPLQALTCSHIGSGSDLRIPLYSTPSQHEPVTEPVGGELRQFDGSKHSVHRAMCTMPATMQNAQTIKAITGSLFHGSVGPVLDILSRGISSWTSSTSDSGLPVPKSSAVHHRVS